MTTHGAPAAIAAAPTGRGPAAVRPSIAVVGAGRAGTALALGLRRAGYRIAAVHSRSEAAARRLAAAVGAEAVPTAVAAVRTADLTLLTVPDRAITRIAATVAATGMALRDHALVHCSGAAGSRALAAARQGGARVGACHPLQAIACGAGPDVLRGVFFGVEGDEALVPVLERIAVDVGGVPFRAPSGDRALYHAAAVLAGNAPLALLARASDVLVAAGVDASVAGPALAVLLEGAARNARRLGPAAALTGPVVRDDASTVAAHLDALHGDTAAQRLYLRLARETLRAVGSTGREGVAGLLSPPARHGRRGHVRRLPAALPGRPRRRAAARG